MKNLFMLVVMGVLLAGCGGGGGGNPSGPPATPTPTTYAVHVKFFGGASPHTTNYALSDGRSVTTITAHPMNEFVSNVQLPVELAVASSHATTYAFDGVSGQAVVVVSPQPTSSPPATVVFATVQATASPAATGNANYPGSPTFNVTNTGTYVPTAGTLTANVGGSVNQNITIPTYTVDKSSLACGTHVVAGPAGHDASDDWGGVKFVSGSVAQATTTSDADFYIEGSTCTVDGFSGAESQPTIIAPYGLTQLSSATTPFPTISTTQFVTGTTTLGWSSFTQSLTNAVTPLDLMLLKTKDGHYVKIAIYQANTEFASDGVTPTNVAIAFSYDVSGSSLDGF